MNYSATKQCIGARELVAKDIVKLDDVKSVSLMFDSAASIFRRQLW